MSAVKRIDISSLMSSKNSSGLPYFGTFQNITFAELEAQRNKETNCIKPFELEVLETISSPDTNLVASSESSKSDDVVSNGFISNSKSLCDLADYCAKLSEDISPNEQNKKRPESLIYSLSERKNKNNFRPIVYPLPDYLIPREHDVDLNNSDDPNKTNGTSCHHCKVRRSDLDLAFCTKLHSQKTKPTKRRCQKKFCFHCLKRCYNEDLTTMGRILSWVCPVCSNTCTCSGCRSKRQKPNNKKRKKITRIELNYDYGINENYTSGSSESNKSIPMISENNNNTTSSSLTNDKAKSIINSKQDVVPITSQSQPLITPSTLPHNINALSDLLSSPIGPNIVETLRSLGISLPADCDPTTIEGGQQIAFAMASAVMILAQVANNGRVLNTSNSGKIRLTPLPPVTTPVVSSPNPIRSTSDYITNQLLQSSNDNTNDNITNQLQSSNDTNIDTGDSVTIPNNAIINNT